MPIDLVMHRQGARLVPCAAIDFNDLERVPPNRTMAVRIMQDANPKIIRFYNGLLAKLVEGTGAWPDRDAAHREMLIRARCVDSVVINNEGDHRFTPVSTAGWDLFQWRAYIDTVMPIVLSDYLPNVPYPSMRRDIEEYVGVKFKDALLEAER